MSLKCQVHYPIFSYVVLRLCTRGSRCGTFRNTFFCLYLYCAVFPILFSVFPVSKVSKLSSLVGEVRVVCFSLFLCGPLSLSLSCMDQGGKFVIYSHLLITYLYFFFQCVVLFTYGFGRVVCSGCCVVLTVVFGCSLLCVQSFAGGSFSWCCCSVHLHCSGRQTCSLYIN